MGRHTPGPWATDTGCEVHKDGRTIFAWPKYSGLPDAEIHANMCLGAAAPDLLEALRAITTHPAYAESEDGETGEPCELIAAGRAAIAKAEGRAMTDDEREAPIDRLCYHSVNLALWDRQLLMALQDAIIGPREDGERIKALEAELRNIAKAEGADASSER